MKYMGGMRKIMPVTYIAMMVSSLSLAGLFLYQVFGPRMKYWPMPLIKKFIGYFVLILGLIAAFMTAFYMFRAIFLVFHGE